MHERIHGKNTKPTIEEAMDFIGDSKELFETVDDFLINELKAEKEIGFSNHDKCWCMGYQVDEKSICEIYFKRMLFL